MLLFKLAVFAVKVSLLKDTYFLLAY